MFRTSPKNNGSGTTRPGHDDKLPPWINNELVSGYHAEHAEIRTILIQKGEI